MTARHFMLTSPPMTGYLHPLYAEALREHGTPVLLPNCGGWVLERQVPGSTAVDAMGCYPLFVCRDWSALQSDLASIDRDWVSMVVVTDPFGDYTVDQLNEYFPDRVLPFKQHFVADLTIPQEKLVSRKHRSKVRKALQAVRVDVFDGPSDIVDDWTDLYTQLIQRHAIKGIAAFSSVSLARQLEVPGFFALKASMGKRAVSMLLICMQGDVAYLHLSASRDDGYEVGAPYALFWTAFEFLAGRGVRWVDVGAGAGVRGDENDGLNRFKAGWASDTRTVYLCGRIFQQSRYAQLAADQTRPLDPAYFPIYRSGEFR